MKLGDLGIGVRIRDSKSDIVFLVAQSKDGVVTLLSEQIVGVSCIDGAEPQQDCHPRWDAFDKYGNNNYLQSNIHQWLNSDQENWYQPAHELDTPPSKEYTRYGEQPTDVRPGFLCQFSDTFKANLVEVDLPVLTRTATTEGEVRHGKAKVYLPSRTEICKGNESGFAEGEPLQICYDPTVVHAITPTESQLAEHGRDWNPAHEGAPLDAPQIYDPKFAWWYALRTPSLKYGFLVRVMSAYGALSYTYANSDILGVRPVCNLPVDLECEVLDGIKRGEGMRSVIHKLYVIKD